jgi:hypothetical protein
MASGNVLYYDDNLDVLKRHIASESIGQQGELL